MLFICLLFGMKGCVGSPTPAAPAPPIQIPELVSFATPEIDLSAIGGGTLSSSALLGLAQTGSLVDLSAVIQEGPETIRIVNDALDTFLSSFEVFEIPVSPQVKTFQGDRQAPGALPQEFKFDFADYDFDGNGLTEGCTGCTCPVGCDLAACPSEAPFDQLKRVCFRIWVKDSPESPFERRMAGFFDILPLKDDPVTPGNEENHGKGQMRIGRTESGTTGFANCTGDCTERMLFGVVYDHKNPTKPEDKSTEMFFLNDITKVGGVVLQDITIHDFVAQVGKIDPASTHYLEKTAKVNSQGHIPAGVIGPEEINSQLLYTGRFRDDADFWSGSLINTNPETPLIDLPTTCARISLGSEVPLEVCQDLGIDTSGEDVTKGQVISETKESDVLFPADFPELPTF